MRTRFLVMFAMTACLFVGCGDGPRSQYEKTGNMTKADVIYEIKNRFAFSDVTLKPKEGVKDVYVGTGTHANGNKYELEVRHEPWKIAYTATRDTEDGKKDTMDGKYDWKHPPVAKSRPEVAMTSFPVRQ